MNQDNNTSKPAIATSIILGKVFTVAGWIITVFFALMVIVGLTTEITGSSIAVIIFCLLLVALGIKLIRKGRQTKERIRRFRQYINIITNQHITSVYEIANIVNKPADFVMTDIEQMARSRFFVNATIDNQSYEIILPNILANQDQNAPNDTAYDDSKAVICKSCGAKNIMIAGKISKCEYCGSPLDN